MLIVDSHHHVDSCRVFDLDQSEEMVLLNMDRNEVGVALVQPFPGAPDASAVHDHIAEMARRLPGRVFGVVSMNPHVDRDAYYAEARRCVRDLGFVGIKLHTIGHAVNPLTKDAETVFETARELRVPAMIHTGPGIPFADPAMVLPRARQFPDLTFVLAHAGFGMLSASAVSVAKECPNVVLETSWCPIYDVAWMVSELGTRRVMFGSDLYTNTATELAKYQSLELGKEELKSVLGETAKEVFRIEA
jgi:uncharacterized protein